MNILAFDTCFGACSAAVQVSRAPRRTMLGTDDQVFSAYEEMATGHAERLLPMIEEVMQSAGVTFADLDTIAVTEGPGTFTGLRVGVAAARALALATGLLIRAASSLHVMAHRAAREIGPARDRRPIVVAVDARNSEVYVQAFSPDLEALTSPLILSPRSAAAELARLAPFVAVGSGAQILAEACTQEHLPAEARLSDLLPHALDLAAMAACLPIRAPLSPLYLRAPDAKPQVGKSLPRA